MSKLTFKYGAMNSGKSTALINAAYNYSEREHDAIIIKPSIDTKAGNLIEARAGMTREIDILATPEMNVRTEITDFIARQALKDVQAILVDEAQFLTEIQVDQLFEVAKFDDISVIAYGLRTDFQRALFTGSRRLFELADQMEKLPTMCRCENQAQFNCRKINGVYVFDGDQVAIDEGQTKKRKKDKVTYDSLCGTCYLEEQAKALAA